MRAQASSDPLPGLRRVARELGLEYVSDQKPGIRRVRKGKAFSYRMPNGRLVRADALLRRIRSLAVPPAWTDVWICPAENGHIQATGRDVRGRKQFRYHPEWRASRDGDKYGRVLAFGKALAAVRRRVAADMRRPGMPREKVLATVVRLLDTTHIRVGNAEYARINGSFGLTTIRNRHAKVTGSKVTFSFDGKGGKKHGIEVRDRTIARLVARCRRLPGRELFAYVDDEGKVRDVTAHDVNRYLRSIAGRQFSAKDFRTWSGTVLAALALRECERLDPPCKGRNKRVKLAIEAVARELGNTPTVCRKSYIHPGLLHCYASGETIPIPSKAGQSGKEGHMGKLEAAVMKLLRKRSSGSSWSLIQGKQMRSIRPGRRSSAIRRS